MGRCAPEGMLAQTDLTAGAVVWNGIQTGHMRGGSGIKECNETSLLIYTKVHMHVLQYPCMQNWGSKVIILQI